MARRTKKTAPQPLYAVGYVRVSTTGQAVDGISLRQQREAIRKYADLHGLDLKTIHTDAGKSAKRADNRAGLQAALRDVCGCGGVLVVYSLSRFARSTRDAIDLSEHISRCGADLASITERIDTSTGMGRFFFRVMASLGELERDQVSERTKAGLDDKRARGEKLGGSVPLGFDVADRDGVKVLIPNAAEQRVIKRIIRLRERKPRRATYQQVADALNGDGVTTKTGGAWTVDSVTWIYKRAINKA